MSSGSVCRAGARGWPFVSHLWLHRGNELWAYSLEADVSASGDDQQVVQASSLLWPLLDINVRHTMGFPHVPAGAGSPDCPVAWWPLLAHLRREAGHSQGPLVFSHPVSGGKASAQPGARLLYSLGSGGRLTCQSNALQGMLMFLKLWH